MLEPNPFIRLHGNKQLLDDDLLKNSATSFEKEEDASSNNTIGESYSTTSPASHCMALIKAHKGINQMNGITYLYPGPKQDHCQ